MLLSFADAAGIGTRYACFDRMARALLGGTAIADGARSIAVKRFKLPLWPVELPRR